MTTGQEQVAAVVTRHRAAIIKPSRERAACFPRGPACPLRQSRGLGGESGKARGTNRGERPEAGGGGAAGPGIQGAAAAAETFGWFAGVWGRPPRRSRDTTRIREGEGGSERPRGMWSIRSVCNPLPPHSLHLLHSPRTAAGCVRSIACCSSVATPQNNWLRVARAHSVKIKC